MRYKLLHAPPYEVHGVAFIFELDTPLEGHTRVLTSTVDNGFGLCGLGDFVVETVLFPCDAEDEADWSNPIKSFSECHCGAEALTRLGYIAQA